MDNLINKSLEILIKDKSNLHKSYVSVCYSKDIHKIKSMDSRSNEKITSTKYKPDDDKDIAFVINIAAERKKAQVNKSNDSNEKKQKTEILISYYISHDMVKCANLGNLEKEFKVLSNFQVEQVYICFNVFEKFCEAIQLLKSNHRIYIFICESDIDGDFFKSEYVEKIFGIAIRLCKNIKKINLNSKSCMVMSIDTCVNLKTLIAPNIAYLHLIKCPSVKRIKLTNLQVMICDYSAIPYYSIKHSPKIIELFIIGCMYSTSEFIKNPETLNIEKLENLKILDVRNSRIDKINISNCEDVFIDSVTLDEFSASNIKCLTMNNLNNPLVKIKKINNTKISNCQITDKNLDILTNELITVNCEKLTENKKKACTTKLVKNT
jgi:hypothetical protein